jgi:hypothetical protein
MIAGIPYNRVHELEFAPGEVRLDVTMESTLALWKTKQRDKTYQAVLKQGRDNLKQLRAGKGTANLKDEKLEQERIAIEMQMAEKEQKRAMAEEQENQRRLQRQEEVLAAESNAAVSSPVLLGVAAAGGIALVASDSASSSQSRQRQQQQAIAATNATLSETAAVGNNFTDTTRVTGQILDLNTNAGAELFSTTPSVLSKQRVNGDRNGNFSATLRQEEELIDPQRAAERAMEEYMNRDDGGSDWLLSLAEILEEEDEEDFVVQQQQHHHDASDDEENFQ